MEKETDQENQMVQIWCGCVERSVRNFEPRGIGRALESDNCRGADRTSWLYGENIRNGGRFVVMK